MKFPRIRIIFATGAFVAAGGVALALVPFASLYSQQAFAAANAAPVAELALPRSEERPILLAQATDAVTSSLPGGASSLQESYQDWQVSCVSQGAEKRCALSQQQADPQSRQRVLAIELNAATSGRVSGALVLPFGLALDAGANIKVDDGMSVEGLRFQTCLPAGCVVPLDLDPALVDAMRAGSSLHVVASPADGSQPIAFAISLKGFSSALDRTDRKSVV